MTPPDKLNLSRLALRALCLAALCAGTACQLLDTSNAENSRGRGSQAFDPYGGARSGAIQLALQMYKGCAVGANGVPYGKSNANIPYPATCENFSDALIGEIRSPATPVPPRAPGPPMPLIAGTRYFLGRLTLMDDAVGQHTDPDAALEWIRGQSFFKSLDWSGAGVFTDTWVRDRELDAAPNYDREVTFGNAAWMNRLDSTFTVEVLDADGEVRGPPAQYSRRDLLAENVASYHTRFQWRMEHVLPPRSPGDVEFRPAPGTTLPAGFRTVARFDASGAVNPFNSFLVDAQLRGAGALRVTWSELPDQPLYFPVTFVGPEDVPATCFGTDGKPAPCDYGNEPAIELSKPANGSFYVPGESFSAWITVRDGKGRALHPPDRLPTWNQAQAGQANGLLFTNLGAHDRFFEAGSTSGLKLAGPLQDLRPAYQGQPTFVELTAPGRPSLVPAATGLDLFPGMENLPIATRTTVTIPPDAPPGTYVALLSTHRQFMGERFSKVREVYFQVGQAERTRYPNRVGNCQICHRGPLSLENLLHGMAVDNIEACKACHSGPSGGDSTELISLVHRIHMSSEKYPMEKKDCTVCHLTRESATRPSLAVCGSCHPSLHGNAYFAQQYAEPTGDISVPDRTSDCAESCHVTQTPVRHVLPVP